MVLQWATKRLCKFFLKRLNKFLNEEIDVEQLDVQLGSGTGKLTDLVLNTDYINEQVRSLPFVLKYGSVARILVRLPSEIEVDGLELLIAPRRSFDPVGDFRQGVDTNTGAGCSQNAAAAGGNCTYLGVNDGVRMIGQMIKSLLLGLSVKVTDVTVGIEGSGSEDYVTFRIPCLEYGCEEVKASDDSSSLVKLVKLIDASVDVGEGGTQVFGDRGISATVRVSIPCKERGAVIVPKLNFEVRVEPVDFRVTFDDVEQLVSVASSYSGSGGNAQESVYHDTSSFYESMHRSFVLDSKTASDSSHGKYTLPVITDWMRKPDFSEPDLDASMEEFFECFDAWNQSASSSGIWSWTRSAFGAASITGNSRGSLEEIQMEYSVSAGLKSLSATLLHDSTGEGLQLMLDEVTLNGMVSLEESSLEVRIRCIEATQLIPTMFQEKCFCKLTQTVLPSFPIKLDSGSRGLKLLRVTSSSEHPAASMSLNKYHPSGARNKTRTKISISLQPLVLWIDNGVVDRMTRSLTRLQGCLHDTESTEAAESSRASDLKLDISIPAMRAFLSAANRNASGCILVLDLGDSAGGFRLHGQQNGTKTETRSLTVTVAEGVLHSIGGSSSSLLLRLSGKSLVDIKWTANKTGPWIAKKIWDSVAGRRDSRGNSSEFASATTMDLESGSSSLDVLKTTSSLKVHVTVSHLRLDISRPEHFAALELFSHLGSHRNEKGNDGVSAAQVLLSFSVREAVLVASSSGAETTSESLQLRVSRLKIVHVPGLGGEASASYLQISHCDSELTGQTATELISCKASDIGRGDGGCRNALSSGTAGLTLTVVSWPGKEQVADVVATGSLKGATVVTEGGQFDWLPAVLKFCAQCTEPFQKTNDKEQSPQDCKRVYFRFDLHDGALRYEPLVIAPEVQVPSSVGCVLAVAALRVSSTESAVNGVQHYCISSRDVGLHLVDTKLRKSGGAATSMQEQGYVQVAKLPVVAATVKVSGKELPLWEVESADNQLNFDTCSDTTAAFARLVSDLQQIFAPDIQQSAELQLRTMKGKSTEGVECDVEAETAEDGNDDREDCDGLFRGIVENAFACSKVLEVHAASCSTSGTVVTDTTVSLVETTAVSQSREAEDLPDSPMFIEDYYLMEHFSQVNSVSSTQEAEALRKPVENDPEPKGGWYQESAVDVFDTHVPLENGSFSNKRTRSSSYPQAVGRVVFTGWKVRWRLYGGSDWIPEQNRRSAAKCVEVLVSGMDLQYDSFTPTGLYASSLFVDIHDVNVYDCSEDAPWRLIMGYYHKRSRPRESTSKAVKLRMDAVRPNPVAPLEEYRLSVALLPIRVHLDQEHLDFFIKFFTSEKETDQALCPVNDHAILPFFQVCEMRPFVIQIDYIPRKLNYGALRSGNCFELLNLCSWKGVELKLKSVHTSGVYGWSSLMGVVLGQWLEDISLHQIHKCLKGAAPIRPVCAVSSGAAKLIVFPAEQYKKDRRFLRGVRKGAFAFLQSISLEALGLGANLAAGAHHILVHTEMVLGGGSLPSEKKDSKRKIQPSDTREGLQQAYESIAHGLERTAVSLVGNPVKVYQRGGGAGVAVASAIKASPAAILAPASAAADAFRHALIGVRNGLDPERKRAFDEKHSGPPVEGSKWSSRR